MVEVRTCNQKHTCMSPRGHDLNGGRSDVHETLLESITIMEGVLQ
jgi:hypothetical protein